MGITTKANAALQPASSSNPAAPTPAPTGNPGPPAEALLALVADCADMVVRQGGTSQEIAVRAVTCALGKLAELADAKRTLNPEAGPGQSIPDRPNAGTAAQK